ncbi:MAG: class I SAM-dependent rRNA methyltransferase [Gammaproteobacteria bacterium]|nr:class I SAM-dependent rRNA methyltransferase [Gammaproteobacteria bacterium]
MLKPGREKAVLRRHPWIFSGAVSRVEGGPASGDCVCVQSADGRFLAWGAYSAASQIVARLWSFEESRPLDETLVQQLVMRAVAARHRHFPQAQALRLINAESDGLPGVVCDRYGEQLVLQLTSAGAVALREVLVQALAEATGCEAVHERSDGEVMALEGLETRNGTLRGPPPTVPLTITESDLRFEVNVGEGQKTGFFLDQRDNRALVRHYSHNAEVLDCFCYTGGFTLNALAGGAHGVTAIDASEQALALAQTQVGLNGMNAERVDFIEDDVFKRLRKLRDQARAFDLIVLDPPKFAPTAAMAERAARGYKDINLLALKLLKPGGLLFTFSCSGGISRDLFQKIIAGAASDAGLPAQIVKGLGPAADHPVALAFPEGDYLKGLLVQIPG